MKILEFKVVTFSIYFLVSFLKVYGSDILSKEKIKKFVVEARYKAYGYYTSFSCSTSLLYMGTMFSHADIKMGSLDLRKIPPAEKEPGSICPQVIYEVTRSGYYLAIIKIEHAHIDDVNPISGILVADLEIAINGKRNKTSFAPYFFLDNPQNITLSTILNLNAGDHVSVSYNVEPLRKQREEKRNVSSQKAWSEKVVEVNPRFQIQLAVLDELSAKENNNNVAFVTSIECIKNNSNHQAKCP